MDMDRVSDRDRLERDEQGRKRYETTSGTGGQGKPPKKDRKKLVKNVFIVSLIGVVILMVGGLVRAPSAESIGNLFRTWNSTNEQGLAQIFNSVQELEDINKNLGMERGLHERDRLYHDSYIIEMVDKEYLVYVFTGDDEKDIKFDLWVEENEEKVQIFRIHIEDVTTNVEILSYIEEDTEPMMLVYNEVERGKKELEGVIKDPLLLDEARDYVTGLIDEKLAN